MGTLGSGKGWRLFFERIYLALVVRRRGVASLLEHTKLMSQFFR